jgi:hypothetical protein
VWQHDADQGPEAEYGGVEEEAAGRGHATRGVALQDRHLLRRSPPVTPDAIIRVLIIIIIIIITMVT